MALTQALGKIVHDNAALPDADTLRVCAGADLIVTGSLSEHRAACVAESQAIPLVCLHYAPMRPTGAYPNMLITTGRLPRRRNLATHSLFQRMYWRSMAVDINTFRKASGWLRSPPRRRPASRPQGRSNCRPTTTVADRVGARVLIGAGWSRFGQHQAHGDRVRVATGVSCPYQRPIRSPASGQVQLIQTATMGNDWLNINWPDIFACRPREASARGVTKL